jgi:hypothetical protein
VTEISLADQITCVRREIAMREAVYPKRVAERKMRLEMANIELARMRAALATLEALASACDARRDVPKFAAGLRASKTEPEGRA